MLRLSSEHIAICEVIIIDEQIAGIGFLFVVGGVIEGGADGGAILRVLGDVETDIVKRF